MLSPGYDRMNYIRGAESMAANREIDMESRRKRGKYRTQGAPRGGTVRLT
jgi:hypothetical protein